MKYCLAIYESKNSFEGIHLYSLLEGYENLKEENLQDILKFTEEFVDENSLKYFLVDADLLPLDKISWHIGILKYDNKNEEMKLFLRSVPFNSEKSFFDIENVKKYILDNFSNRYFMGNFFKFCYSEKLDYNPALNSKLEFLKENYEIALNDFAIEKLYLSTLKNFLDIYLNVSKQNNEIKFSQSKLAKLAMFAINFERQITNNEIILNETDPYMQGLYLQMQHYNELINSDTLISEEKVLFINEVKKIKLEINEYNKGVTRRR